MLRERHVGLIVVFVVALLVVGLVFASAADTEVIDLYDDSTFVSQRTGINLISGTNITVSSVDNPSENRVDFTITGGSVVGSSLTDDNIWLGDSGGVAVEEAVPDCIDSGGNHLNYTVATNTFSCGTTAPAITSTGQVIFEARKESQGTITKGSPVHLHAFNPGGWIDVEVADADDPTEMPVIGLAAVDLTNSSTGTVILTGELTGLNTSGFTVLDELYISTTAGVLTATKPTGNSAAVQKVAQVARVHGSQGVLEVFGAGRSNDLPNITDDNIWVGSATDVPTITAVGDCDDSGGNHLNYDTATNAFSCGITNGPVAAFTSGTADDVTIGGSTPTAGTFTTLTATSGLDSFTSVGIDDNANVLAMTISNAELVGIGTANPNAFLHTRGVDAGNPLGSIIVENDSNSVGSGAVILFRMDDSGDATTAYAQIEGEVQDNSSPNEKGTLLIRVNQSGTMTTVAKFDGDGLITFSGEMILASPTGGGQGAGTINAVTLYDDGVPLSPIRKFSITIEDPTNAEDISVWRTDPAMTITRQNCVLVGSTTPSVTLTLRHGTDRDAAGAELNTGGDTITSVSTGHEDTTFDDPTVVANSFFWLETTAQSGTVLEVNCTWEYDLD